MVSPGTPGGEVLVVRPRRRPVGGILEDDVEGARHVVIGERGPGELEERQVEGRLEVPRQVRLDERRADGAQIVGESDPDPRLLANLRTRIGRRRERRVHAARTGPVRLARVRTPGHVLGPHEALDYLEFTLVADRGDAARQLVIAPRWNAARAFTASSIARRRASIASASGAEFVGPVVLVRVHEFVVAGPQFLTLGLLLIGGSVLARGWIRPKREIALQSASTTASAHFQRFFSSSAADTELLRRELVQENGVVEPHSPGILFGEQVPRERPARRLVGFFGPDEARHGRYGGDVLLGQYAPHQPAAGPVALIPSPAPRPPFGGRGRS